MALILPYQGNHPITQPFGHLGLLQEPRGYLQADAGGARRYRAATFAGGAYHDHIHPGIDVGMAVGTPLLAAQAGHVVAHGFYYHTASGALLPTPERWLMLQVRPGTIVFYTHLSAWVAALGAHVAQGAVVAKSGASGNVTGPHLHWELRIGPATGDYHYSSSWFRYNAARCLAGGDLAGMGALIPG